MALIRSSNPNIIKELEERKKKLKKSDPATKKGGSLLVRIQNICEAVQKRLGHYADQLELITSKERLHDYITHAIEKDIISIDTETTGLDPITDQIVGACIYTRDEKPAYIPINHIDYISGVRIKNQLNEEQVREEFQRLVDADTKAIFFNAKFDIRVMRWQLGVDIKPAHCGFIAGKCLKEDEPEGNLKFLWKKYCCPPDFDEPALTFDKMFEGIKFNLIPISTAYLYAAKDALMTLQLYDFQMQYLDENNPKCQECHLEKVAKLYREIELPIISIVADIEDQGVVIDAEYAKKLSVEYNDKLKEAEKEFLKELENYQSQIDAYISTHPDTKLENPVNINSPIQLAELFYDVLKQPVISKKDPRGTGKDILKTMNHPLCKHILEYKNIAKLVSTYIDALPQLVNKKTGRLHCSFNQYGAATGRFSSSNPNFQNIPSRGGGGKIRMMFKAADYANIKVENNTVDFLYEDIIPCINGEKTTQELVIGDIIISEGGNLIIKDIKHENLFYHLLLEGLGKVIRLKRLHLLVGSDFSQQEPKLTADLSNDEHFIKDCASGKDAYATIASIAFKVPYEECMEFYLDENGNKTHEVNKKGKERRSTAKILLLGICYGKTMKSIAEDLNKTEEEAQEIYDAVMTNISGLKHFMEETQEFARQHGYVEDRWGRRRHIPDMMLEPYVLTSKGNANFDPFFDSAELGVIDDTERLKQELIVELQQAKWRTQKDKVKMKIEQAGFILRENTKKIEDATRQCVNCVDEKTEILTKEGWKNHADLSLDDEVLTMNPETCLMEWNKVIAVNRFNGEFKVKEFKHPSFSAITTLDHRWFVWNRKPNRNQFVTTEKLALNGEHRIFRCGDNQFKDNTEYSDDMLHLIGMFLTDGNIRKYSNTQVEISQSTKVHPIQTKFIEDVLNRLNIPYGTSTHKDGYKSWVISYDTGKKLRALFPERKLTGEFIGSLSQRQAMLLIDTMVMFDGSCCKKRGEKGIICSTKDDADMFQYLCHIAGKASVLYEIDKRGQRAYGKVRNKCGYIETKSIYYIVRLQARTKAHIYKHHVFDETVNFVWCPTVKNGTWVARRLGKTYVTGNSVVQGSASTQSKLAVGLIGTNKRLKELGFKMAILVHDEVLGEVPYVTAKEAVPIFQQCMLNSAKDLRTGAKCDMEISREWYGKSIELDDLTFENLQKLKKEVYM